jgi:hypothetical protein
VGYIVVSDMEIRNSELVIKALVNNGDRSYGNMDVCHVLFKVTDSIFDKKIM